MLVRLFFIFVIIFTFGIYLHAEEKPASKSDWKRINPLLEGFVSSDPLIKSFSKHSSQAKTIIFAQMLELTVIPIFTKDSLPHDGCDAEAFRTITADQDLNQIANSYREGILAGYIYTFISSNDLHLWEELVHKDSPRYKATNSDFSDISKKLSNRKYGGIASIEYEYLFSFGEKWFSSGNRWDFFFVMGFSDGKRKAEYLIGASLRAARNNRLIVLKEVSLEVDENTKTVPEIEAIVFLKRFFEDKIKTTRKEIQLMKKKREEEKAAILPLQHMADDLKTEEQTPKPEEQ